MVRDDYDVLTCKVLTYLYKKLRGREREPQDVYLQPMTKFFPVEKEYFEYLIENLQREGLIEGVIMSKTWSGPTIIVNLENIRITPAGIRYLRDNSLMKRIREKLPDAASIAADLMSIL